jgi:hypothetical protein
LVQEEVVIVQLIEVVDVDAYEVGLKVLIGQDKVVFGCKVWVKLINSAIYGELIDVASRKVKIVLVKIA